MDECGTCDGSIVDLGCGCGEDAATENYDCDGNCVVGPDCTGECGGTDTSCLSINKVLPIEFEISSAYPNPFNPVCQFSIANPKFSQIEISIYNIQGKLANDLYSESLSPGVHNFHWNAQNFQSGLYFIKVNYDNHIEVMRVLLIK